jgi:hypothetical protein
MTSHIPLVTIYSLHANAHRAQGLDILEPVPPIGNYTLPPQRAKMVDALLEAAFGAAKDQGSNVRLTFDILDSQRGGQVGVEFEPPLVPADGDTPIAGVGDLAEQALRAGGELSYLPPAGSPNSPDIGRVALSFQFYGEYGQQAQ